MPNSLFRFFNRYSVEQETKRTSVPSALSALRQVAALPAGSVSAESCWHAFSASWFKLKLLRRTNKLL
jgi:hypothetical protein